MTSFVRIFDSSFYVRSIDLVLIDQQSVGKKPPSDGHCQCEKEMDDHLLASKQILEKEPHSDMLS
jgi:hypothetical protein